MKRTYPNPLCAAPNLIIRDGTFYRIDDAKTIQRFRCKTCGKRFSAGTFSDFYQMKKRRINAPLLNLLASGISLRRSALLLKVNPKTTERKLPILASICRRKNSRELKKFKGRVHDVQIDDLITKENSKLKPLSVSIAVDEKRRRILGAEVSVIPAFGRLTKMAVKKYGKREDQPSLGLTRPFNQLAPVVSQEAVIKSDEHKRCLWFVAKYFP
jgi:transposase-like protein